MPFEGMTVGQIRELARQQANESRSKYWPEDSIPVDPIAIARKMGASVFAANLEENTYGMVISNASGADIYVDQNDPPTRKRFTVAHELGHVTAYVNSDENVVDFVEVRDDGRSGTAPEIHANEFAGELLMPQDKLVSMIEDGYSSFQIADFFGVSVPALQYRRKLLGV